MQEDALTRLALITDLRHALDSSEFAVFYQPIVSVRDGMPVGAEALVRWHHPRRGLVAPAEFVGVAESTGLIVAIVIIVLLLLCGCGIGGVLLFNSGSKSSTGSTVAPVKPDPAKAPLRPGPVKVASKPDNLVAAVVRRVLFYTLLTLVAAFFALPLLWLVFTPFDRHPSLSVKLPEFTLDNFRLLLQNPYALSSLKNSVFIAGGAMVMVVVFAALAAYALSRVRIPGRDALLYGLLLLSSIVTGTAAMVPIFLLMFQLNLIDSRTGVSLVLAGGLLPAAIFILKDFMDATPRSYEESARVFGASPLQVLRHIVLPIARPGLATIAVWALVNAWGDFLIAFILLRDPDKSPAGVVMYTFYTEGGQANLPLISAFSLLYAIPVVAMYLFVSRRYGFRFHGGIKG